MGAQASSDSQKKAHFTFIWTIENVSGLDANAVVKSPNFIAQPIENTKWKLIYHSVLIQDLKFIKLVILREDSGTDSIEIEFELSILAADGTPLRMQTHKDKLKGKDGGWFEIVQNRDEVFVQRRDEYLPHDTLTVRCRMWRPGTEISKPDTCFARTRISVDRRSFVWAIRQFSSILPGQKRTHFLNPPSNGSPQIILRLFLTERNGKNCVSIEIDENSATSVHGFMCKFSLLDSDGRVVHSRKIDDFIFPGKKWFGNVYTIREFLEKDMLINDQSSLLPNDVLSLRCEFHIDAEPLWNRIENYRYLSLKDLETTMGDIPEMDLGEQSECFTACCPFKKAFENLYGDESLSDVSLQIGATSLPAHKTVLSVRSPVFKTMFRQGMRKKTSKIVEISDMNSDTLGRLLLYIYKDTVENLQWESAMDLFRAADKYQLIDLRKKCASFLKLNFSEKNICSILPLTEKDANFLNAAVEFIISDYKKIFKSDAWKIFKMENLSLASEITELVISLIDRKFFYSIIH